MALSKSSSSSSFSNKPIIVIHRHPSFTPFFNHRLSPSFTLLDPVTATGTNTNSGDYLNFLESHATEARALACLGPSPLSKQTLDCLPSLECVVVCATGVNHVDLENCRRRGISVTNIGDAFSDDVSDYAVGLLVDVLRKISPSNGFIRAGSWPQRGEYPLGSKLGGKRIGIVGLGSIGSRISKRLLSFGCSIAYNSLHKKPCVSFPFYDTVYDLALQSDVLIICCSLTDKTYHMVNKEVLNALGKDGILINVSRGTLVDEQELVRFLVEGRLGGAGIDVFEDEPNVPQELLGLYNVVLSPHRAALTPDSLKDAEDIVVANLEAFFSNKPLLTPIRWE